LVIGSGGISHSHGAALKTTGKAEVVGLVDLDKQRAETDSPKVIVTEFNNVTTSFLVTGVTRIHRMSWESVEPPNRYVSSLSGDCITGVVKLEDRIVFLLDLEKIVADLNPNLGLKLDMSIEWNASARYRALIADDSVLIREMLKDLLNKANFDVEAVQNGREAWDLLSHLKDRAEQSGRPLTDYLQVVVADIEMPSMDGHNLTKRIKDDPVLRQLPVILFSSLITDKLRHKGEAVGADDQISKPDVAQLAMRAKNLIQEKLATASAA
ncbi:MAG: response regulator, partial [Desulfovibrio sp.]|nr:response regulator [Desulfovibrio sp.]